MARAASRGRWWAAWGASDSAKPVKTVVSYWPYATTLWDYTNRSMPFDTPGVLTNDQMYAVVAYVSFLGGVVGENDVLDAKTLPRVKMPNRDGFVPDDRPDAGAAKSVSAANQVAAKKE